MCPPMNIRQGGIWVQARYEGDRQQGGNPSVPPIKEPSRVQFWRIASPTGWTEVQCSDNIFASVKPRLAYALLALHSGRVSYCNLILSYLYIYSALWRPPAPSMEYCWILLPVLDDRYCLSLPCLCLRLQNVLFLSCKTYPPQIA